MYKSSISKVFTKLTKSTAVAEGKGFDSNNGRDMGCKKFVQHDRVHATKPQSPEAETAETGILNLEFLRAYPP